MKPVVKGELLPFTAVAAATAVLTLAVLALIVVVADHDGRSVRDAERGPRLASRHPGERVTVLWAPGFDDVGGIQHAVVAIAPLTHGAVPPPGLSRWPGHGEAVLSPALLREGEKEGIGERYGRLAGLISREGLVSVEERLAYVRLPRTDLPKVYRATGFGDVNPLVFGESQERQGISSLLAAVVLFIVFPACALFVTATRVATALPPARRRLPGALAGGTLVAGPVVVVLTTTDVRLPVTGYVLSAHFMARWLWPMCATLGAVAVVAALLGRKRAYAAPVHRATTFGVRAFVGCTCVTAAGTFAGTGAAVVSLLGAVGFVLTLPAVITAAVRRGAVMSSRSRLAGAPGGVSRLAWAVAVPLVLVFQLVVWTGRSSEASDAARQTFERIGTSVATVHAGGMSPDRITTFHARLLPKGWALLKATRDEYTSTVTLHGECRTLSRLGMECADIPRPVRSTDPRAREILRWTVGTTGDALSRRWRPGKEETGVPQPEFLLVVGEKDTLGEVKRIAYRIFPRVPAVDVLGASWLTVELGARRTATWVTLLGLIALALTTAAGLIRASADFHILAGEGISRKVAWWGLAVPVLLITLMASAAAWWLGGMLNMHLEGRGWLPWSFFGGVFAVTGTSALLGAPAAAAGSAKAWRKPYSGVASG
ncbi:hypothetical protein [Sinosporangium siamense]|uniref:Uncharacterized protein n=1 Tax=Sinosporangium siamense TaxID=1367973 RepID=A0A919VC48_9ACTN|nr:hypothetical protein [Sinosporangium siamense]GII92779.1 hypothetical protein Ssi02_30100 [Sinosporangium siamense]